MNTNELLYGLAQSVRVSGGFCPVHDVYYFVHEHE
jgi:hypothetical protein